MSLSQLYELEDGGNSRFYSDSLRRQAGRRVARLLGADWDNMALHERTSTYASSNVVPLQRPASSSIQATLMLDEPDKHLAQNTSVSTPANLRSEDSSVLATNDQQAVSIGLATPASETLLINPSTENYTTKLSKPEKTPSAWVTVVTLLLMAAAGAAGAYVFVEYSPYRLYWPW
jgi:hypothetical protein